MKRLSTAVLLAFFATGCCTGKIASKHQEAKAAPMIALAANAPHPYLDIIEGKAPAYKIYEDRYVFAFLRPEQINLGHVIIVPKIQVPYFLDLEEPYYSAVFKAAKRVGKAIHRATGCQRVGSIIHGYSVPHFHLHLIPMFGPKDIWDKKPTARSKEENEAIQKKILEELQRVPDDTAGA